MKRILVFLMILCMALGSVCAAADTLPEGTAAKRDVQQPSYEKGGLIANRLFNFWPVRLTEDNKWKKVASVTLEQGDIAVIDFGYLIKGSIPDIRVKGTIKDESVAELSEILGYTIVNATAPGATRATFVEEESGKKCTLRIKVIPAKVKELAIASTRYEMKVGETLNLKEDVVVLPTIAANKELTFKSDGKKIASVDKQGLVTAKKAGEAVITVQSKQNKKVKEKITITVVEEPTSPAQPASDVTYRFFGVGQSVYEEGFGDLPASETDLNRIAKAFGQASVNGAPIREENIHTYRNLTGNQIAQVLDSMADCGADANDVTVFYYSGHGTSYETEPENRGALIGVDKVGVRVETLRKRLDKVPGNVVVILDSRLSGQFIQGKSPAAAKAAVEATARNMINVFASSTARNFEKALPDSSVSSKYKILVACQPTQQNFWTDSISLFTSYAAPGLGVDYKTAAVTDLKADADGNDVVSLNELHRYVEKNVAAYRAEIDFVDQVTMVWPANDRFPVLPRT